MIIHLVSRIKFLPQAIYVAPPMWLPYTFLATKLKCFQGGERPAKRTRRVACGCDLCPPSLGTWTLLFRFQMFIVFSQELDEAFDPVFLPLSDVLARSVRPGRSKILIDPRAGVIYDGSYNEQATEFCAKRILSFVFGAFNRGRRPSRGV